MGRCADTQARYSVTYRHSDCALVLKVTDDKVCLKHKTSLQNDVKKIEKYHSILFRMFTLKSLQQHDLHELESADAGGDSSADRKEAVAKETGAAVPTGATDEKSESASKAKKNRRKKGT